MVFSANCNNISAISWQSINWLRKSDYPENNHRTVASHKLNRIMLYRVHLAMSGIRTRNLSGDMH
jgi:hypothetical protein